VNTTAAVSVVDATALAAAGVDVALGLDAFLDALAGPTIVRVAGRDRSRRRVLSGTIHGNEPSGARALHRLLRDGVVPATDLLLFFGALDATRTEPRWTHRMPPGRRDLNRCFRGPFDDDNGRIARAALDVLLAAPIEAAVDIHNTTGKNPDFIIAGVVDDARCGLASLFSGRYLAWRLQLGTLSEVLDDVAVAITFECGQTGDDAACERAWQGALRFATLDVLPGTGAPSHVFRDPVRVRLQPGTSLRFDDVGSGVGSGVDVELDVDVVLDRRIDRHNFTVIEAGTRLGTVRAGAAWPLRVDGDHQQEQDWSRRLFTVSNGALLTAMPLVPMMMTTNAAVAQSDCLFYATIPGR
jgi:hypothetical protein